MKSTHSPLSLWPDFLFVFFVVFFALFLFSFGFVWFLFSFLFGVLFSVCLVFVCFHLVLFGFILFLFSVLRLFFFFALWFLFVFAWFCLGVGFVCIKFFLLWGTFLANVSWFPSGHVTGFIFTDGHSAERSSQIWPTHHTARKRCPQTGSDFFAQTISSCQWEGEYRGPELLSFVRWRH